jgi:3-isopropylmalate/(R)-2-methylmalate dehydratase small subunit
MRRPVIRGSVHKLGHDVDTDALAPGATLTETWEKRRASMLSDCPGLVERVAAGDLFVAGRNFGCGSSREQAPENLRELGVASVVAESFARIFFRNCVAIGVPLIECPGIHGATETGDEIEVDIENAVVRNLTRDTEHRARPLSAEILEILRAGGLLQLLRAGPDGR